MNAATRLATLHVITTPTETRSHADLAREALAGGARVIQLREKRLATAELLALARHVRAITREVGALLIINDRLDIAIAAEADGVHLGQEDLPLAKARALVPDMLIGVSCGTRDEAIAAERAGADYIGFGHMYPTSSKLKTTPQRTLQELSEVAKSISIPVIAIGGITLAHVAELMASGASGVAVISAISAAKDPKAATTAFVSALTASVQRPTAEPPSFTGDEFGRYSRQLMLGEVGFEGQAKLRAARVCLIGAGGLGTPAAMYLAAAGVGTIGLVDFDTVDVSNLHRQVLYGTEDVGGKKASVAAARLATMNPNITINAHEAMLTAANAEAILSGYDIIVDGSDNFLTRYLVNDVALRLGKPVVFGAIFRFTGQLSLFGLPDGPCYRCLFPEPPDPSEVPSCAETGVLGVLPGVIGMLQATETIKLITGIGEAMKGRLLMYDALAMRTSELRFERVPDCPACGHRA